MDSERQGRLEVGEAPEGEQDKMSEFAAVAISRRTTYHGI